MPYLDIKHVESKNGKKLEGNDKYEGYVADLASEVSQRVGIDYVIEPVKDGKYGAQNEDGTWNGMIGELIRGVSVYIILFTRQHTQYKNNMKKTVTSLFCLIGNWRVSHLSSALRVEWNE